MNSTQTKPAQPDTGPVLFDQDYREFILMLMERLDRERSELYATRIELAAFKAKVDELSRRVR